MRKDGSSYDIMIFEGDILMGELRDWLEFDLDVSFISFISFFQVSLSVD